MTNLLMVFATVAMYSLSTTHFGLAFRQNLIAFFDQRAIDGGFTIMNDPGNPLVYTQIAVEIVNVSGVVVGSRSESLTHCISV